MIDITFTKIGAFDVSQIPEQWRDYVKVKRYSFINQPKSGALNGVSAVVGNNHFAVIDNHIVRVDISEMIEIKPGDVVPAVFASRVSIAVQPDDSSYRYRALMQPRQLVLKFALPFYFEFPVGSSVTFEHQTFYFKRPQDLKKQGERNIEYSITMYADDSNLGDYKIRNSVDGRLKWSMCARPHEFIEEIVKNLNAREGANKWSVGTCIESTEKTVEFNHTYLDAALTDIANVFETEYEITADCKIHLRKVEYNKTDSDMLALSYGRGNGFVPGVGRSSEQGGEPIKRMYAQGGERNINRATYGEMLNLTDKPGELLLPLSATIRFDGTHFEGEDGFNADIARTYQSDAHGYYIERIDKVSNATKEDSLDCSEIYPSRVGECSGVVAVDPDKNLYDFIDSSIPANLDFGSYIIPGETMTVIFQTGMLAGDGKEFEVKYYHDSVNGKAARRFEIVPQEIDGITMPNDTFKPKAATDTTPGDKYAVFGIQLPKEYICNDTDKSGASWDMMRECVRKLYDCEEQKFTFSGELQSMWAKRNWENVGGYLVVGGYVRFTDNQFAPDGTPIRIIGIKDFITNPYAPKIELSNAITSPGSASSSLRQIDNTEVVIDDTKRDVIRFTKRRFRDALETIGMLEDAQLDNFNSAISPVAIQTMAMLVGDESLQFLMGKTIATIGSGDWAVEYKDNALNFPAGYLRHMTIGVNSITANREYTDYLTWQMPSRVRTPESNKKYYVYAVVNRTGFSYNETLGATICNTAGEWVIDDKSHRLDEDPGKYYLLVGVLNSEYQGERSFATLYGFTKILPGRMTTDVIKSSNGESYFDLAGNRFKLGDNLGFNVDGTKTLRLRGAMVQSSSGDVSPLPCYRGVYSATTYYFNGDVVSFTSNNNTSTYICVTTQKNGIVGISPLLANAHWEIYAKGANGANGTPGTPGQNAPIMVFVGNYDTTRKYYGNSVRVDCVRFGSAYYVAKTTAPNGTSGFSGIEPGNNNHWQSFGATFESIATGLLLAENANIANLIFRNQRLESTAQTIDEPNIIIDGITGNVKFGWLRTIGRELLGFDNSGTQRLRFTPFELPTVNSSSSSKDLIVKSTGGDATFTGETDTEVSFEQSVHCYYGSDDHDDDIDMNFYGWVEFDIEEDSTLIDFTDIQFDCSVKRTGSNNYEYLSCSMTAYAQHKVGTSWENIGSVSLNGVNAKITIPKAGRIRIAFNGSVNDYVGYDCTGTFSMTSQRVKAITAKTEMIIAKDGFMAIYNSNYMRMHSTEGFIVKIGNYGLKIDSSGIKKMTDGTNFNPW